MDQESYRARQRSARKSSRNHKQNSNYNMPTITKTNGKKTNAPKPRLTNDHFVKDLSLADWGRKEISVAEQEMPGLMSVREKYGAQKPLDGVRVSGSLHMTIETAELIQTLAALGASGHWASCHILSS